MQDIPGSGWMNTIGDMENTEGYYAKVAFSTTLEVEGIPLASLFTIPLLAGWNMMSYPYEQPKDAMEVLQNLIVTISNTSSTSLNEKEILAVLKEYCSRLDLRRLDEVNNTTELSLNVEFKSLDSILKAKNALKKLGDIQFSFIETY